MHTPLPLAGGLVRVLGPVVAVAMLTMLRPRQEFPFGGLATFQLVGDDEAGDILAPLQQLAEEGAVKVTGRCLKDQQTAMLGAGSAGIGDADGLRAAMRADGLPEQEARSRSWVVDKDGLLHAGRTDLTAAQRA